jgi:hypothetical protein
MTGITIEHHQIRNWTESRGARPVMSPADGDWVSPQIRFPEDQNAGREVSWDEWLSCFDRGQWAFIWQDTNNRLKPN